MRIHRLAGLTFVALLCASCGSVVPSDPSPPAFESAGPKSTTPGPTTSPASTPVAIAEPTPATTASPSSSPTPTYVIRFGDEVIVQEPGTIIFGSLVGPLSAGWLEPFLTWPEGGLTYEARVAFGAFWGAPRGAPAIRITLYRVQGGTLHRVWSDVKRVDPEATGYIDELVPFKGPGTYRLEVTRSSSLLAWGVAFMGPRCETNCSGG